MLAIWFGRRLFNSSDFSRRFVPGGAEKWFLQRKINSKGVVKE